MLDIWKRLSAISGVSLCLLGMLVLIGWLLHAMCLIQVLPGLAPMQLNTTLGFLAIGASLAFFQSPLPAVVLTAGLLMALLIGILMLSIQNARAAQKAQQRLVAILENTSDLVGIADAEGRILYHNQALRKFLGRGLEEDVSYRRMGETHTSASLQHVLKEALPTAIREGIWSGESTFLNAQGQEVPISQVIIAHKNDQGDVEHFSTLARDISKAKQAEAALQESKARFRSAIEAMHEGVILYNQDAEVLIFNHQAEEILGITADQLRRVSPRDSNWRLLHEDGSEFAPEEYPNRTALREGVGQQNIIIGVHKPDGTLTWISVNAAPMFRPGEAQPYAAVVTFSDITERRWFEDQVAEQITQINDSQVQLELQTARLLHANLLLEQANTRLEALATTDGLTGLNNHRAFQDRITEEFQRGRRYNTPLALLLLDVDHFKAYNDAFGHPAGDAALQSVASILHSIARATDFVARYGGEEFAILLTGADTAGALEVAERIRQTIASQDWELRPITVSIGVSVLHAATESASALIEEADANLYTSKREGRNRITYSDAPPASDVF